MQKAELEAICIGIHNKRQRIVEMLLKKTHEAQVHVSHASAPFSQDLQSVQDH